MEGLLLQIITEWKGSALYEEVVFKERISMHRPGGELSKQREQHSKSPKIAKISAGKGIVWNRKISRTGMLPKQGPKTQEFVMGRC